ASNLLPCMCWADDVGGDFFVLDSAGILRRIALDGLTEQRRWDVSNQFNNRCSWLSRSSAGLVLTLPSRQEVWVVQPDNLTLRHLHRIFVPSVERAVSAPTLDIAFAPDQLGNLYVLDLERGTALVKYTSFNVPGAPAGRAAGFGAPVVTPDGKYLFATGAGA